MSHLDALELRPSNTKRRPAGGVPEAGHAPCKGAPVVRHAFSTMQRMSIVNRETQHNPTPEYMQELMRRIGKSQTWVAERTGISRRRIQYLLVGSKIFAGVKQDVRMTYPEQHILECLAEASENLS